MWFKAFAALATFSAAFAANEISCSFSLIVTTYTCSMAINNLNYDNFPEITGVHTEPGKDNSHVAKVQPAGYSSTQIFPRIICKTFVNLKEIDFESVGLKELTGYSFADCTKLTNLNMKNNLIFSIQDTTFSHTSSLLQIDLSNNRIPRLTRGTFNQTASLQDLNLSKNLGLQAEPFAFFDIANLQSINLMDCSIQTWEQIWFSNNAKLEKVCRFKGVDT